MSLTLRFSLYRVYYHINDIHKYDFYKAHIDEI